MVDDRCQSYQGSSSRRRCYWWKPGYEPYKRGLNTKIHLAVDANGMPVRILVSTGTRADCKEAVHLIEGIDADALLADRAYDTNEIIAFAQNAGMETVIPPKKNRKMQREYDEYLYRLRHLVENAFLVLKRWRGIATRYAKNTASFLAAVRLRCIFIWTNILA
jgi:transposase